MNKLVLVPDHFYNCPICNQKCVEEEVSAWSLLRRQGTCQQFLCNNPLVENRLHYYSHFVEKAEPTLIAYQEFSIDIGNRYVIFGLNLLTQKTIIKDGMDAPPLELDVIIRPDYSNLEALKNKIRTAITFS